MGYIQATHPFVWPITNLGHFHHPLSFGNLERLTELWKALYVLLLVYYKGSNSGAAKCQRYISAYWERTEWGTSLPSQGVPPSQHLSEFPQLVSSLDLTV